MNSDIQAENRKLHRQLKTFVTQARENEDKLQRFNAQELELISATSLPDLIRMILHEYPQTFRLDCISLTLYDPEYELVRMLEQSGLTLEQTPNLQIEAKRASLQATFPDGPTPQLGTYLKEQHSHCFPVQEEAIRSCAFLPLVRRGELIGSLNMGSVQPERFVEGSGTDFLQRLAAIVAICLENCANHQRLKQLGLTDPLTRVNNRRYFDQRLGEEVALARRKQWMLGCMFLDVDHFKRVNDSHGHQTGDMVLREIALVISSELRHSDVLCRYGGEEFVILLPGSHTRDCTEVAERIRQKVERHPFRISDRDSLSLTLSIGISNTESGSRSSASDHEFAAALLASADEAVYLAKNRGRNQVLTCNIQTTASDCREQRS